MTSIKLTDLTRIILFLAIFGFSIILAGPAFSEKKVLGHSDFDAWEKVSNHSVSNDGEWISFSVNPQEGDGTLTFYSVKAGKKIEIPRGYQPKFSSDSKWGIALIKPFFKVNRQAKIDGKSGFDLPQDSLVIVNLKNGEMRKYPEVISYKIAKDKSETVAWLSCDTSFISQDALDEKKAGRPLFIEDLKTGNRNIINWVADYSYSDNGEKIALRLQGCADDSLATKGIGIVELPDTSLRIIDRDKLFYSAPVISRDGAKLAYVASVDSVESGTKNCNLYYTEILSSLTDSKEIVMNFGEKKTPHRMKPHSSDPAQQEILEKEWKNNSKKKECLFINQYSKPVFSYNGGRLVIGVAPYVAPDDTTLVDFEKASLDIWRWDAPYIPPKEQALYDDLLKHTYPVVIDLSTGSQVLVTDTPLADVSSPDRWDADWALVEDPSDNIISSQWDYQYPVALSVKNILDGEERRVGTAKNELYELSPSGKYVMWFQDKQYYCYEIATGETALVSEGIPYPLWEESQDIPLPEKEPYGTMGWSKNDEALLIYDKYDVWSLDPSGKRTPYCLTAGEGRKKNLTFRDISPDPDFRFFTPGDQILYSVYDNESKKNGLATAEYILKPSTPSIDILDGFTFYQIRKSKDRNVYSWVQGNFETSPNVYVSTDISKKKWIQISNSNPQLKDYKWGTANLVEWTTYDGSSAKGILYLPEDFNENESYPMLTYFYEELSDFLYHHFDMEPSWSWINFPFYVSRGYVVFVPDVHYTAGLPGENAYNYICSGVEEMCRRYPSIDKNRLGIDGQSWGGYQAAYLVTRTNMFACAGAGAPVANMTSAFGGIRWESGDSRQAQYEMGQSRIGRNLWEAPELYIANSPLFYADRINTPLLIMHNDEDGAVPWYQGIELFMALRRLGKPVWMLTYNGEAHNIKERRNRKDITIRLQQFFDHYLKGDPMPEWMKNGIPIIRKGQEYGY